MTEATMQHQFLWRLSSSFIFCLFFWVKNVSFTQCVCTLGAGIDIDTRYIYALHAGRVEKTTTTAFLAHFQHINLQWTRHAGRRIRLQPACLPGCQPACRSVGLAFYAYRITYRGLCLCSPPSSQRLPLPQPNERQLVCPASGSKMREQTFESRKIIIVSRKKKEEKNIRIKKTGLRLSHTGLAPCHSLSLSPSLSHSLFSTLLGYQSVNVT